LTGRAVSVVDGVWMVGDATLSHPKDACVYLIDGGDDAALIDAGAGDAPGTILENIVSTGKTSSQIKWIIATHCHIDHTGGMNHIRKVTGADIICHALCAEPLEAADNDRTAATWYGTSLDPVDIDETFDEPEKIIKINSLELHLLHTPGHSPGSISVWADIEGKRVLFGQDIHGPFSPVLGSDIEQWKVSMAKLLDLKADILCEGHYGVMRSNMEVEKFIRSFLNNYE